MTIFCCHSDSASTALGDDVTIIRAH